MSARPAAKKSVASELISALTRPKGRKQEQSPTHFVKQEEVEVLTRSISPILRTVPSVKLSMAQKPPVHTITPPAPGLSAAQKKKVVNDDWINFLKKKEDVGPRNDDIDILKIERPNLPAPKKTNSETPKHINKTEIIPKAKTTPQPVQKMMSKEIQKNINSKDIFGGNADKDKILKNLLNQVSDLESTMGASISKLEAQLKGEQEKSLKLKIQLDDEKETNSEFLSKVSKAEKEKETIGNALKTLNHELKEEKGVNIELFDKTINLERAAKVDKQQIEKLSLELKQTKNEIMLNKVLKKEVEILNKWKSTCMTKIQSTKVACQNEHIKRIETLEDNSEKLEKLLEEVSKKVPKLVQEFTNTMGLKDDEIKNLNNQLANKGNWFSEREMALKESEKKLKENEKKLKEKETDMQKVYDLVNKLQERLKTEKCESVPEDLLEKLEQTGTKRKAEELVENEPVHKKTANSDEDDDIRCVLEVVPKEVQIKEALKLMITQAPTVVEKVAEQVPMEEDSLLDLTLSENVQVKKTNIDEVETETKSADDSYDEGKELEKWLEEDLKTEAKTANSSETEPKHVNLEIKWKLRKWPKVPEILKEQSFSSSTLLSSLNPLHFEVDPRLRKKFNLVSTPPLLMVKYVPEEKLLDGGEKSDEDLDSTIEYTEDEDQLVIDEEVSKEMANKKYSLPDDNTSVKEDAKSTKHDLENGDILAEVKEINEDEITEKEPEEQYNSLMEEDKTSGHEENIPVEDLDLTNSDSDKSLVIDEEVPQEEEFVRGVEKQSEEKHIENDTKTKVDNMDLSENEELELHTGDDKITDEITEESSSKKMRLETPMFRFVNECLDEDAKDTIKKPSMFRFVNESLDDESEGEETNAKSEVVDEVMANSNKKKPEKEPSVKEVKVVLEKLENEHGKRGVVRRVSPRGRRCQIKTYLGNK